MNESKREKKTCGNQKRNSIALSHDGIEYIQINIMCSTTNSHQMKFYKANTILWFWLLTSTLFT